METKLRTLSDDLKEMHLIPVSFDDAVKLLFNYSYKDYNEIFKIDDITIPDETYKRLPVFNNENCVAILMLWGAKNKTAIHDHKNYDGMIKVLKGNLTEVYYKETAEFIEYEGEGVAPENAVFAEDFGGIHSIVNNEKEYSVSLHIYRTSSLNLDGVRLFDTENKKIGILSEKAPSCSWKLETDAYKQMITL